MSKGAPPAELGEAHRPGGGEARADEHHGVERRRAASRGSGARTRTARGGSPRKTAYAVKSPLKKSISLARKSQIPSLRGLELRPHVGSGGRGRASCAPRRGGSPRPAGRGHGFASCADPARLVGDVAEAGVVVRRPRPRRHGEVVVRRRRGGAATRARTRPRGSPARASRAGARRGGPTARGTAPPPGSKAPTVEIRLWTTNVGHVGRVPARHARGCP